MELKNITNNFKKVLGEGGFGIVYHGCLEDGTQIAAKMQSRLTSHGAKNFLAEVHIKLYRQNSQDKNFKLGAASPDCTRSCTRLKYLHKGCKPPMIHRDVKTANILLSENLEAKIADFGVSKAFQSIMMPSNSAKKVMCTASGVVLLELVTGQPPLMRIVENENTNVAQMVRQKLARGDIEDIVDARLRRNCDINLVWKFSDVALRCTLQSSHQRPSMTDIVKQVKECLAPMF
ncbi:hypothetical protein ZIOFF_050301 [Zingiber officinale]|uniref:Protein kinase domain-containing protein n=1 Tax=Zingiber officinale TaxID=94328 RepID=A0A8J5FK16_ZINOF|nr:hypothetical protein ZIOFF_050301 [Zingiber officinale]